MEIRQIRSLLVVAEVGSLLHAGKILNIAQPALSRQIRMLEQEVSAPLFVRHARGMRLTEAGEVLVEHCRRAMRSLEIAKSDITALTGKVTGTVVIGLLPSVSDRLAGRIAVAVREKYPLVRLKLLTGLAEHLLDWLNEYGIDLAIVSGPVGTGGVEFQPLVEEPLYLVGRFPDKELADETIPLEQLSRFPLILPSSDYGLRGSVNQVVHSAGVDLNVIIEANSLHVQRKLITAGVGYALFPSSVILESSASNGFAYSRIVDPTISRCVGLAVSTVRKPSSISGKIADIIIAEMRLSIAQGEWPGGTSLLS